MVWERIITSQNELQKNGDGKVITKRVSIAGIVKSAVTALALAETEVTVMGTDKSMTSNQEGLFFFEELHLGNYVLTLNCPGYVSQNCNVLVDSQTYTFKEVLLTPA